MTTICTRAVAESALKRARIDDDDAGLPSSPATQLTLIETNFPNATPNKDAFFRRLGEAIEAANCFGSILVADEDPDDDDALLAVNLEEDYSESEISRLRFILINKKRKIEMDKAMSFASPSGVGGAVDVGKVLLGLSGEVRKAAKRKNGPDRFNALFALTYALAQYPAWIPEAEQNGEGRVLERAARGIEVLATAWKTLLQERDAALGIDAEFTRPGIEALLGNFERMVAGMDIVDKGSFDWRP